MEIFGKKIDGVMILIAILVIAGVSWGLVSVVNAMLAKGNNAVAAQQAILDKAQFEIYNNKLVSGDTVINAIHNASIADPQKIKIVVATSKSGNYYYPAVYGWTFRNNPLSSLTAINGTGRFFTMSSNTDIQNTSSGLLLKEDGYNYCDYVSTFPGNTITDIIDPLSPYFINPSKTFLASYKVDMNDVLNTLYFVQQ